ncbi:hypothetical protein LMB49_03785 [Limosilactobacillus reuteri]|uniref:hypothetical protein n=1 Tax=Limosilactobacillus reuteri TaxID=1598 RepID=UPI001E521E10|nr:hypothetical protein [Limosilactobacillus reuteri]MCC4370518.1 hypothetical protein [Limosilactobacillus reuteri]MCC4509427.1 hypothetical protein [Limosilactobacillus reuteri]
MAKQTEIAGEKMSLRSGPFDQIFRIGSISNNVGPLGDSLVSTLKSTILGFIALFIVIMVGVIIGGQGGGLGTLFHNPLALVMIVLGSIGIGLNVFFVNPSQGSQAIVSWKYIIWKFTESHNGDVIEVNPYRFTAADPSRKVSESIFGKRKRYLAIYKVQGTVSPTSFDADLEVLASLNQMGLKGLERDSVRTTLNRIGSPHVQQIPVATNATPAMLEGAKSLKNTVDSLGAIQALDTMIIVDAPTVGKLRSKVRSQENSFNKGLVITYRRLAGDDLQRTFKKLFS